MNIRNKSNDEWLCELGDRFVPWCDEIGDPNVIVFQVREVEDGRFAIDCHCVSVDLAHEVIAAQLATMDLDGVAEWLGFMLRLARTSQEAMRQSEAGEQSGEPFSKAMDRLYAFARERSGVECPEDRTAGREPAK